MKNKRQRLLNLRKTSILTLTFFLFFTSISVCKGTFSVSPRELSITMIDKFVVGNTSGAITVGNEEDVSINISWYIDHPEPIDSIRPNRTKIPDLSWIDVEPKWQIISPNGIAKFYVYLNVPEDQEYLDQHWESWITFRQEKKSFINLEAAVRLYIDTPLELLIDNNDQDDNDVKSISVGENVMVPFIYVIIAISLILAIFVSIRYVKKKK